LERYAQSDDPMLREHAKWARARLGGGATLGRE
jgi:hypothetical protein